MEWFLLQAFCYICASRKLSCFIQTENNANQISNNSHYLLVVMLDNL